MATQALLPLSNRPCLIEAGNVEQLNLLIQFIRTKVNAQHQIIHEPTLLAVQQLMNRFMETVNASGKGS